MIANTRGRLAGARLASNGHAQVLSQLSKHPCLQVAIPMNASAFLKPAMHGKTAVRQLEG